MSESSRRDFLKGSVTAASSGLGIAPSVHAAGTERFNVALVGCGNRGTGAAADCLNVAKHVRLKAVADLYEERAKNSLGRLKEILGEQVDVPQEQVFLGLDAISNVLACDIDLVILTTPPGFRPMHYRAAIEAGKHVFMEKPCCVDAGAYRSLIKTNQQADEKGLKVINRLKGRKRVNAYQKEHIDLLNAIWTGKPYNEGWAGADSSFTAVIACMASYSGKVIKWDEAMKKGPSLFPLDMAWDADPPVMPNKDGRYEHAVAVPGVYRPFS
jgi:hypothetical protein